MHSWGCMSSKARRQFGLSLLCLFSGSEGKLGHASFIEIFQQRVGRSFPHPHPHPPRSNSGNTQKKTTDATSKLAGSCQDSKNVNKSGSQMGRTASGEKEGWESKLSGTIMGLFSQRTALPLIKCALRFARNPVVYAHTLLPATEQRHVACNYPELNTRFYSASLQTGDAVHFFLFFFFTWVYLRASENAGRDKNCIPWKWRENTNDALR